MDNTEVNIQAVIHDAQSPSPPIMYQPIVITPDSLNFTNIIAKDLKLLEGLEIVDELETDMEKLSALKSLLSNLTGSIHEFTPLKCYTENLVLKHQIEGLKMDRDCLILEKEYLRKLGKGYGLMEMAEEILKKERQVREKKVQESYKRFDCGIKIRRVKQQLREGGYLDAKNKKALLHIKKAHTHRYLESCGKMIEINEERETYMSLLIVAFERVKGMAAEVRDFILSMNSLFNSCFKFRYLGMICSIG
jgi:hypothetical protein